MEICIKNSFLNDHSLFSPEINLGEDVPFTYNTLIFASRVKLILDSFNIYRINDASLTGVNRKLSPSELYEKCFINAKLVQKVADYTLDNYCMVRDAISNLARYTISLYPKYYSTFSEVQKLKFTNLCRKGFLKDFKTTYSLFSKRKKLEYIKLLLKLR